MVPSCPWHPFKKYWETKTNDTERHHSDQKGCLFFVYKYSKYHQICTYLYLAAHPTSQLVTLVVISVDEAYIIPLKSQEIWLTYLRIRELSSPPSRSTNHETHHSPFPNVIYKWIINHSIYIYIYVYIHIYAYVSH